MGRRDRVKNPTERRIVRFGIITPRTERNTYSPKVLRLAADFSQPRRGDRRNGCRVTAQARGVISLGLQGTAITLRGRNHSTGSEADVLGI